MENKEYFAEQHIPVMGEPAEQEIQENPMDQHSLASEEGTLLLEQVDTTVEAVGESSHSQSRQLRVLVEGYQPEKAEEAELDMSKVDEHWLSIYRAYQNRMIMQARLVGIEKKLNRPCAVVRVGHVRGYIPLEHSGFNTLQEMRNLMGEMLAFKVTSFDREGDVFTASRLLALEHMASLTWQRIEEGQVADAVVRSVHRKRLRVDIGGILVTLPVEEVDYGWIDDLGDSFAVGDHLKVKITHVRKEKQEIKVSAKALKTPPWPDCTRRYRELDDYVGKVSGVEEYGVFVNLERGVDALCKHMPFDLVSKGEEVLVRILKVDVKKEQIRAKIIRKL
ncbi:S1 RNA-binding domain-containing protein [Brevibacillus dissolubilis]|uniref:S1 RNA-binding domain-containing protein n=1 Tax=Brevibacillus dissolubilis TaxID=1844116 RepID=UPI00210020B1|nr:S1 RNA-binding domain-containing protein [Brevibacillus dissolubilis]